MNKRSQTRKLAENSWRNEKTPRILGFKSSRINSKVFNVTNWPLLRSHVPTFWASSTFSSWASCLNLFLRLCFRWYSSGVFVATFLVLFFGLFCWSYFPCFSKQLSKSHIPEYPFKYTLFSLSFQGHYPRFILRGILDEIIFRSVHFQC